MTTDQVKATFDRIDSAIKAIDAIKGTATATTIGETLLRPSLADAQDQLRGFGDQIAKMIELTKEVRSINGGNDLPMALIPNVEGVDAWIDAGAMPSACPTFHTLAKCECVAIGGVQVDPDKTDAANALPKVQALIKAIGLPIRIIVGTGITEGRNVFRPIVKVRTTRTGSAHGGSTDANGTTQTRMAEQATVGAFGSFAYGNGTFGYQIVVSEDGRAGCVPAWDAGKAYASPSGICNAIVWGSKVAEGLTRCDQTWAKGATCSVHPTGDPAVFHTFTDKTDGWKNTRFTVESNPNATAKVALG